MPLLWGLSTIRIINDRAIPILEAMRTATDQTSEYKHIHTATGQRQSSIERYKQWLEDERKKENPDQAQIFLADLAFKPCNDTEDGHH